jgi:hypothetical protein
MGQQAEGEAAAAAVVTAEKPAGEAAAGTAAARYCAEFSKIPTLLAPAPVTFSASTAPAAQPCPAQHVGQHIHSCRVVT